MILNINMVKTNQPLKHKKPTTNKNKIYKGKGIDTQTAD